MIKIVPWADRKLSMKNWRKIWNLFPYGEICMTEIDREWEHQNWAEKIARYYVTRGRKFSVEVNPETHFDFILSMCEIGVRKFYFTWRGVSKDYFLAAFEALTVAQYVIELYPDAEIVIIYSADFSEKRTPQNMDMVNTSIYTISYMTRDIPQIKLLFRYPHPWSGQEKKRKLKQIVEWLDKSDKFKKMDVEPLCGCITITPNTNIYPCEFCKRRKRKKLFGNAARDKHVCGTIDRGIFREVRCNVCEFGESKYAYLKHKEVGGE